MSSNHTLRAFTLSLFLVTSVSMSSAVASQLRFELLPSARPNDANFRLADTYGFSVSWLFDDSYRLYATTTMPRVRWNSSLDFTEDLFHLQSAKSRHCWYEHDPRVWDEACIDTIGLYSKAIPCAGGQACGDNDLWNAYPGTSNVSTFPAPDLWPKQIDFGVNDFSPVMAKEAVNDTPLLPPGQNCSDEQPCPPKTGAESTCFPNNPDAYATGVANPKALQVYYFDGSNRWFMAFNTQIHSEENQGLNSADKWRVAWAYSDDGQNWTVDNQILLRSTDEALGGSCAHGFLLTGMVNDDGHFYLYFTRPGSKDIYVARSLIDGDPTSVPGYVVGTWRIAALPLVDGEFTWKTFQLGEQIDADALQATSAFPPTGDACGVIRQSAVARVFTSLEPGSEFRHVGVANDVGECASGTPRLDLFSADSLNEPFVLESQIDYSGVPIGAFGVELGFTNYPDNLPTSPRIEATLFDFWMVQDLINPDYPADLLSTVTVSRLTGRISGGIFSLFSSDFETGDTSEWSSVCPPTCS